MLMILEFMDPVVLDRESISTRRVKIDDFPYFTKLDLPEVLWKYMKNCLEEGIDPMVDIHNMSDSPPDRLVKRKKKVKEVR